jgi:hypothetical protein
MKPEKLYVVGQRRDGSYETFTLFVPDGEGLDMAAEACTKRCLVYIHCSRPKSRQVQPSSEAAS